jgi:hypothetical protein
MEGLCVVIRRLAYPNRLEELSPLFGRTKYELSNIFNTTLDFIYDKYSYLLDTLNIAHFYGPVEGRRHHARTRMLRESGVEIDMRSNMTINNEPYCVYAIKGAILSANQARFNERMSAVRICVEWGFGKLLSLFAFLDYKENHKLYLQPNGKYYKVALLLTNCHTCLYGSETGSCFGLNPPSLHEYLLVNKL